MLHFVRFETTAIASGESGCVPDLTFMAHGYLQPRHSMQGGVVEHDDCTNN
jgi:hypothetical protein